MFKKNYLLNVIKYLMLLIHPMLSLIILIYFCYKYVIKNTEATNILKFLLMITTLSLGNRYFFKIPQFYGIIKYIFIIILFFNSILYVYKIKKISKLYKIFIYLILYFAIVSLLKSSRVEVSIIKLIYYFMGNTIIYSLVRRIKINEIKIILLEYMNTVFILVLLSYLFKVEKILTGFSLQGIYDNPNPFGIILVLFTGIIIFSKLNKRKFLAYLGLIFFLLIQTKSRTAMISFIVCIFTYYINLSKNISNKIIKLISIVSIAMSLAFMCNHQIEEFFLKKNKNILFSRESQLERNIKRFKLSPLIGSGFAVENDGSKSLFVEKGNIILQFLSDGGIIGLIMYIYICIYLLRNSKLEKKILFLTVFMGNLGEASLLAFNGLGMFNLLVFYIIKKGQRSENNFIYNKKFKQNRGTRKNTFNKS